MNRKSNVGELKNAPAQSGRSTSAAELEIDAQELIIAALLRNVLSEYNEDKEAVRSLIAPLIAEERTLGLMLHSPEPGEEQRVIEEALATLDSRLKLHNQTGC